MAQQIVSWFVCDGRFRLHAINAVGRRKGRIVEVEEVDSGERFYGSARRLKRLVDTLRVPAASLVTLGFGCLTAILRLGLTRCAPH